MSEFMDDKTSRLGAALAFYTTFSVAPLLVMAVAVASLFFGADAVQGQLKRELLGLVGKDGAEAIQAMIAAAGKEPQSGFISSLLGIVALLFGATGVFVELKDSMNTIWGVEPKPGLGIWGVIQDRALSFAMVLTIAFMLLVSMVLSTVLSALGHWVAIPAAPAQMTDFVISTFVITILFMMIFKYLPDAEVQWKDVWVGAIVTALLFTLGKYMIGLYLGSAAIASAYGAAGSLVVFLLWTYYSSQILFFGAQFTQVYAQMKGRRIAPSSNAQAVTRERRAQQGLANHTAT